MPKIGWWLDMEKDETMEKFEVAKNPSAVALGRLGGKANTKKQNNARKKNGKKGGRPKKKKA